MNMTRRHMVAGAVAGVVAPALVRARTSEADKALLFGLDMSDSMRQRRSAAGNQSVSHWELQHSGTVAALTDPATIELFTKGGFRTALAAVAWSGPEPNQGGGMEGEGSRQPALPSWAVLVPWTIVGAPEGVLGFAAQLAQYGGLAPRGSTGHGLAILQSRTLFEDPSVIAAPRKVLDISTDQVGMRPVDTLSRQQRQRAAEHNIGINALAVMRSSDASYGNKSADEMASIARQKNGLLVRWLEENVVTPGGFVMRADGYRDFARALKRKIEREMVA